MACEMDSNRATAADQSVLVHWYVQQACIHLSCSSDDLMLSDSALQAARDQQRSSQRGCSRSRDCQSTKPLST